jgi:hypothetical protein
MVVGGGGGPRGGGGGGGGGVGGGWEGGGVPPPPPISTIWAKAKKKKVAKMLRIFYMEIFPFVRINQWDLSSLNSEPVNKYMGIFVAGNTGPGKKEFCQHELSGTLGCRRTWRWYWNLFHRSQTTQTRWGCQ